MSRSSHRPLSRDRALSCVSLNFSLSGLGSLRAGRIFAGICQLGLAFGGFFLFCAWIIEWCYRIMQSELGETVSSAPADWLWQGGIVGIGVSYSWMLITCASLMRQAKAEEEKVHQNVPPKLADLRKKDSENP